MGLTNNVWEAHGFEEWNVTTLWSYLMFALESQREDPCLIIQMSKWNSMWTLLSSKVGAGWGRSVDSVG